RRARRRRWRRYPWRCLSWGGGGGRRLADRTNGGAAAVVVVAACGDTAVVRQRPLLRDLQDRAEVDRLEGYLHAHVLEHLGDRGRRLVERLAIVLGGVV